MKTIRKQFESYFSKQNLSQIFQDKIVYSGGTGIDNISQYSFRKVQDEQIEILSRKMLSGNYEFTKYKLKLISKGRGKPPRELSIPTIRDRISLRAMCNFLQERFKDSVNFELPQTVVRKIKTNIESGNFSGCIKLDVSDFYPSINHSLLIKQLDKRLRQHADIKRIILSAISVATVLESKRSDTNSVKGVPQGLSISNILAAIYLQDLDKYLNSIENSMAFRYVDDILILCDHEEAEIISKNVIERFLGYDLVIHCPIKMPHKSSISKINDGFNYLGYDFKGETVSVKQGSIDKLKASLVGIFTNYKYAEKKSIGFLKWRLNLRITGCVFENKSKGWVFFFSEINNEKQLHELDHFIDKLCRRFNLDIEHKNFVRTFHEIVNKKHQTKYVPNFDTYSLEQKSKALTEYFSYDLKNMAPDEIEYAFHKKVSKQIKELESDIKDFSVSG